MLRVIGHQTCLFIAQFTYLKWSNVVSIDTMTEVLRSQKMPHKVWAMFFLVTIWKPVSLRVGLLSIRRLKNIFTKIRNQTSQHSDNRIEQKNVFEMSIQVYSITQITAFKLHCECLLTSVWKDPENEKLAFQILINSSCFITLQRKWKFIWMDTMNNYMKNRLNKQKIKLHPVRTEDELKQQL